MSPYVMIPRIAAAASVTTQIPKNAAQTQILLIPAELTKSVVMMARA